MLELIAIAGYVTASGRYSVFILTSPFFFSFIHLTLDQIDPSVELVDLEIIRSQSENIEEVFWILQRYIQVFFDFPFAVFE